MLLSDYKRETTGTEPVTLAMMKNYLRENYGTDATEDTLLTSMILGARLWIEDETRRAFVAQTVTYYAFDDEYTIKELLLPYQPITEITSVNAIDLEGTETEYVLNTNYYRIGLVGGTENILRFSTVISTIPVGASSANNAIRVIYNAGYSTVPADVIGGIMKLVAENYVNREASVDWSINVVPFSVQQMINHYKVYDL